MDYKYIHQLLDRYFAAETTAAEEAILRTFFSQDDVPAEFLPYRDLFAYEASCASETLGSNFDSKMLALVGATGDEAPRHVQSRRFTLSRRLRPLYNAAASVAIVLLLGTAAQHAFRPEPEIRGWDYNAAAYKDSYDNPREAYETLDDGIRALRAVLLTPEESDSLARAEEGTPVVNP